MRHENTVKQNIKGTQQNETRTYKQQNTNEPEYTNAKGKPPMRKYCTR